MGALLLVTLVAVAALALKGRGKSSAPAASSRGGKPAEASGAGAGEASAPGASEGCPAEMVHVAGGRFSMGSPEGEGRPDEHPAHEVTLGGFCLDRREVTVAAYRSCVEQPGGGARCKPPGTSRHCNGGRRDRDDHPINCVDWSDAEAYCAWAKKRLPTEAEWELAARAGSEQRVFPWGSEPPMAQLCWDGEGNDAGKGARQGSCVAGAFGERGGSGKGGILDLAGNVAEWVMDSYAPYRAEAVSDPRVGDRALQIPKRVVRGGSWFSEEPGELRASARDWFVAGDRTFDVGFRCAR